MAYIATQYCFCQLSSEGNTKSHLYSAEEECKTKSPISCSVKWTTQPFLGSQASSRSRGWQGQKAQLHERSHHRRIEQRRGMCSSTSEKPIQPIGPRRSRSGASCGQRRRQRRCLIPTTGPSRCTRSGALWDGSWTRTRPHSRPT